MIIGTYFFILLLLSLYGLHRYVVLYLYYRHKPRRSSRGTEPSEEFTEEQEQQLPTVTVQLPLYNEQYVVERIITAAANLDYPKEKLLIQVLDDSTDATSEIAQQAVHRFRQEKGLQIQYIHRSCRDGFKAGALKNGMLHSDSELIAIFDADFVPDPDFLLKTVPQFSDPDVSMVQTRWGYLNRNFSLLTRIQALLLDGHFALEHAARYYSGRFFNFNGTAGVWRRSAIEKAGGWEGDTLTEDLDLSYRAQIRGARFVFLPHVECKSELPVDIEAFKRQQYRWACGAVQTARKLMVPIWRSDVSFWIKLESTVHLTSNVCYVLLVILSLLMPLSVCIRINLKYNSFTILELLIFIFTILSISIFYLVSQRELYEDWKKRIWELPMLFCLGIGMCINDARAVVDAFRSKERVFERTPKYCIESSDRDWKRKKRVYQPQYKLLGFGELGLLLYLVVFTLLFIVGGFWTSLPLFMLFVGGYAYVFSLELKHQGD